MGKLLLLFVFSLSLSLSALEYQLQFEDENMTVAKITIAPHEEIPLHRDVYPSIVVALKGGIITRLESDGRKVDVSFPTGVAIKRGIDPEGELHKSLNNSDKPIELIVIQIKKDS